MSIFQSWEQSGDQDRVSAFPSLYKIPQPKDNMLLVVKSAHLSLSV